MSFLISTDSTTDLPKEFLQKNHIPVIVLSYTIKGKTYAQEDEGLDYKTFYNYVREGELPTTSQANPEEAKELLGSFLKESNEILYLAFSSGLSGTYNNVRMAADELMEENPGSKIIVIDTLAASLGEGLVVYYAVKLREEGKTIEETADWIRSHLLNFVHVFTVDDLFHLWRGGRVSKGTAVAGTVLNIKPMLHVDNEGHLINIGKCRGRRKSLTELVDMMEERLGSYRDKNEIIFISHSDCEEDAVFVSELIKEKYGITNFLINPIGPTIGSHTGVGTVALFFLGDYR